MPLKTNVNNGAFWHTTKKISGKRGGGSMAEFKWFFIIAQNILTYIYVRTVYTFHLNTENILFIIFMSHKYNLINSVNFPEFIVLSLYVSFSVHLYRCCCTYVHISPVISVPIALLSVLRCIHICNQSIHGISFLSFFCFLIVKECINVYNSHCYSHT